MQMATDWIKANKPHLYPNSAWKMKYGARTKLAARG